MSSAVPPPPSSPSTAGLPAWTLIAPVLGAAAGGWALAGALPGSGWVGACLAVLTALALVGCVLAAVHHAEVVAHRLGEPLGTLLLAVAITVIEVGLIVSLMLSGGKATAALARDTVFAAVMLILNGIVGLCLLLGASRHGEQQFGQRGVSASLATLAAIAVLTLVLPNFTISMPGPVYSRGQLAFVALVSLILYGTFVLVQTVRHRDYFLPESGADEPHAEPPPARTAAWAGLALVVCLGLVVGLAKALAPVLEHSLAAVGAPASAVGIVIAAVVLLPEGLAALRAARANRLQTSLNLALGSALASIGLTIPAVAAVSLLTGWDLVLGLDNRSSVLLMLSLFVANLSLATGRTTVLQGTIHLVLLGVYVLTTLVP